MEELQALPGNLWGLMRVVTLPTQYPTKEEMSYCGFSVLVTEPGWAAGQPHSHSKHFGVLQSYHPPTYPVSRRKGLLDALIC